jgi:signal transduction histidine kinase
VRRLVDEVLSATNRRCPIELLLAEVPAEIQADERLLQHIFTNLLTNAVKYSDPGQVVGFEIACAGAEIICIIRDQGSGFRKPTESGSSAPSIVGVTSKIVPGRVSAW